MSAPSALVSRPAAIGLVLLGIASVQLGAGAAKSLFDEVSPIAVVWLRLVTSTVILVLWARPSLRGRSTADWWTVVGFGVCLGTMNWAIYESFSRIPIGVAVTIEFIGPLAVATLGIRRLRDLAWIGLAAGGVVLLGAERADFDLLGVSLALLAGAAWAGYLVLSAGTGRRWEGIDGLALASLVAMALVTPAALASGGVGDLDLRLLAIGAAVGVLSSVVPYASELVALRRLHVSTVGVMMSLEPAAAALAGLAVLGEQLDALQWLAIGCVVVASVGATRAAETRAVASAPPTRTATEVDDTPPVVG